MTPEFDDAVETLALLADPVRRAMYQFVRSQPEPVTREQVAAGTGTSAKLAAFHLEKLLQRGLVDIRYQGPGTRPAGGRPAKLYEPARREVSVSVPDRRYDLLAQILAGAARAGGEPLQEMARQLAYERGRDAAEAVKAARRPGRMGTERTLAAAREVLNGLGYDARAGDDGAVVLTNCPFDSVSGREPETVCGVNASFVAGVLEGLGGRGVTASIERAPARCCVVLRPAPRG